jgi:hypothetical protein
MSSKTESEPDMVREAKKQKEKRKSGTLGEETNEILGEETNEILGCTVKWNTWRRDK